jgi:DNA polymerase-3 subunit epsilon
VPLIDQPLVFLDLETTGGSAGYDRIIEIGLVEVAAGGELVGEWSTLVNPGRRVPHAIQSLTGIAQDDVDAAPRFEEIAEALFEKLEGRVFAAHNARFDYGFLKAAFARTGRRYEAPVLCTVRLSRKLAPQHPKHNLDALIARHAIFCLDRHRALGDARVLWELACIWRRDVGAETLAAACADLLRRPAVPPGLPADLYDTLPETAGVYVFYDESGAPLYVGHGGNVRSRIAAHFAAERRSGKDRRIADAVKRAEWRETAGELSAHLEAARMATTLQPLHNRLAADEPCAWYWRPELPGTAPRLVAGAEIDEAEPGHLYGAFRSRTTARTALRELARAYALCHVLLGLEAPRAGAGCSAHEARQCRGACVGAEPRIAHAMRAVQALSRLRIDPWPYRGPIAIRERHPYSERAELHVVDRWRHIGTAMTEGEAAEIAHASDRGRFDLDIYRAIRRLLKAPPRGCEIIVLAS